MITDREYVSSIRLLLESSENDMNGVFSFFSAALPWIAMGLLLAIFFARSAGRKKKRDKKDNYGSEGMALGMCLGVALGTSLHMDIGVGLSLGMLLGLVVGSNIEKEAAE